MSEPVLHGVLRAPHEGLHGACKVARPLGDRAVYAPAGAAPTCKECLDLGAVGWEPPHILAERAGRAMAEGAAAGIASTSTNEEPAPAAGEEHTQ